MPSIRLDGGSLFSVLFRRILPAFILTVSLPLTLSASDSTAVVNPVAPQLPRKDVNKLGYKTYQPILNVREPARRELDYDIETGAVVEAITVPTDRGNMVLEVHHRSVFDYLEQRTAVKEDTLFESLSSKYLMGESDARRGVQRRGLMPDINLPDLMPKALASIIGEGTGSLSIHGRSVTEISGTTTFQKPEDTGLFRQQSKFPRLKLEQRQQINIEGVIGTKIHVFVDYNSQNEFDNRNRIEVRYVGEEDEILQSLELGDVNLNLPPSMLVAANIPRGNFGIKGQTRLGALTTTFIASKEEGESSKKDIKIPISGEVEASDSTFFRDVNFSRNRHFLLVDPSLLATQHVKFLDRNGAQLKDESRRPTRVRVFKDNNKLETNYQGDSQARPGIMYVDPTRPEAHPTLDEFGFFNEMEINREFVLEQCGVAISFVGWVGEDERVGAMYTEQGGTQVGSIDAGGDTLRLKLIKSSMMNPENPAWNLMMRNVYSFGSGTAISPQSFSVDIFSNNTPPRYDEGGRTFLDIFGLDNDADTKVDRIYVDFTRGLIFFPSIEPFYQPYDEDNNLFDLLTKNRQMYVEDDPSRLNSLEHQRYNILVRYNRAEGSASRSFELGAMQIIENSERIYINDQLLRKDVDYSIDYQFGQVTLMQNLEIPPNSEVKVHFEEVPLFATGNTSLFGFHNEYEFDPQRKNYLNSTLFVQNVESVDRSFVRLGDEPKTSILGEFGGKFEFDSDRVTEWLNKLPMLESRVPSRISLVGGVAFSNPNPNTRGGVLIEDFETSKIENPRLMMHHQAWRLSSVPKASSGMVDMFDKMSAGNIFWFDPHFLSYNRYGWYEADVYGAIEGRTEQHREVPVSVMSFVFEPHGNNELERRQSWRTVVQAVSNTGVLGMNDREFLQVYIAVGRDQGKLIIDFGRVDEDQVRFNHNRELVGEGILDTEDKNFDGRLDHNEDTGLDGVAGADPRWSGGPLVPGDDGNDDYYRPPEGAFPDARFLNLTEGNNKGQIGASFDTEDLNNNGVLDRQEDVYRITIDLENLEIIPPPGVFIPDADRRVMKDQVHYDPNSNRPRLAPQALGYDDWYLIEIPLPKDGSRFENYYEKINSPSLSRIMHVRLGFYDFFKTDTVNIAAINFVGNRFKVNPDGVVPRLQETFIDTLPGDTLYYSDINGGAGAATMLASIGYRGVVEINSINTVLNNEYYPPPLISATLNKYNRSGRAEDFTAQEASLAIRYKDLQRGYEGWALKAENNQQSYLDYAAMSFYLNGRQSPWAPRPTFFIRIGTDRDNFYEYSTPVDTGWAEIEVPFEGFLTLKDSLQGSLNLSQIQSFQEDIKRGNYRIKGNPSLTKIAIMTVGVSNETSDVPTSGEVWIDDVRLTNVIREFGLNSRVQVEAQLSDVGRLSFGVNSRDNKFRNLNDAIPRNSSYDYNIGASLNIDRFTPLDWGLRLPATARTTYRLDLPRFHPGSEDVPIIAKENKDFYKTESRSNSYSLSYAKARGSALTSKLLFDRLTGQLSVSSSKNTAPRNLNSSSTVNSRVSYRATLPREADLTVFPRSAFGWMNFIPLPYFLKYNTLTRDIAGARFRYMPNDFELSTTIDYRKTQSYNNTSQLFRLDSTFNANNAVRLQYRPFQTVQGTFNLQTTRNLLETALGSKMLGMNIGNETGRRQQVNLDISPRSIPWLQPSYRYSADYNNDHNPQYARSFGPLGDFRKFDSRTQNTAALRFMLPQFRQSLAGVRFTDPNKQRQSQDEADQSGSGAAYRRQPQPGQGGQGDGVISRYLFKPINFVLDSFDPFTFQASQGENDRWEKMERDPGFMYQIGLRKLDLETRLRPVLGDTADFNTFAWNFTRSYQSGMRLFQNARIGANYVEQGNNSHTFNGYRSTRQEGPEFSFDYSNLYIPSFLRGFLFSLDFASGYGLKKGDTGNSVRITETNPAGLEVLSREERWNPKVRLAANWGKTGNIRTLYTKNGSVRRNELIDQNRRSVVVSDDDAFNVQYSFSAPQGINLPFLRGIRLQSNVRTSLDVRQRLSQDLTHVLNNLGEVQNVIINRDTEDFSITPTLSYDFAQVIGSLSASYNTYKDRKNGTTRVTIMMRMSVTLDF